MEYFTHEYKGIKYEFKPNRVSQAKIQEAVKDSAMKNPNATKELSKIEPKLEKSLKKIEKLREKLSSIPEDDEKARATIEDELEKETESSAELTLRVQEISYTVKENKSNEDLIYMLLEYQKAEDFSPKYPNLTRELFDEICDDIENKYGLSEYELICGGILEDVFTIPEETQKAEFKSDYLRKRANRNKKK